ncbi:Ger(x)C family spore germination protein [Pelosinus sp. IPA-1]|uniref:Ger(x)C family spore germination protein n=1 Tax=Pelosinus sp. IPA-1 TaxID=3029569 RepID=UPI0024361D85|nr:Ger(x)C family spore germination protein [Pelosinus sp. IPA-1]GMA98167.1 germination protein [Pelosinus sp. IPA-1]
MKTNKYITIRIFFSVVLLVLLSVSLTGCWSSHEIDNLALIDIMGIDQDDSGQFELTVSIVSPAPKVTGTGKIQLTTVVETATGKTLYEAIGKLSSTFSKEIYFGNLGVVVVGEKAARNKMESVLDFLKRDNHIRPYVQLLITRERIIDIIKTEPLLRSDLGSEIQSMVTNRRYRHTAIVKDLSQFLKDFSSDTKDSFTGEIRLAAKSGINIAEKTKLSEIDVTQKDTKGIEQNAGTLSLQGSAVFKDKQYIGWLNDQETRGLLLLRGELTQDIIVVNCPQEDNGSISIMINKSSCQLSPRFIDGQPVMDVNIKVDGDILDINCPDFKLTVGQINQLNAAFEEEIRQEIMIVLDKTQKQWQTDVFGFGDTIYHHYPNEWNQIANQWRNGGLSGMKVDISIVANVSRSGLIKNPIKANESR